MRSTSSILFADIQGSTALMQENEKNAIILRRKFKNIIETNIEKYHGKIIQFYGDGSLLIFQSGLEAVEFSIVIQKEFRSEPVVPVRIGLDMGDIIIETDSIYGDCVNIASRIESASIPGAILISDKMRDSISNQTHIKTKSLGIQSFKNVSKEIEVFAILVDGIAEPDSISSDGKVSDKVHKIAVLPLNNFSGDTKLDHVCDGLTEEIINYLAEIPNFKIASRTSTFAYKGKDENVKEIGKQLGVDLMIEGSIREYSGQHRVTIQLIDIKHGFHVSSKNYDIQKINNLRSHDQVSYLISQDILVSLDQSKPSTSKTFTHLPVQIEKKKKSGLIIGSMIAAALIIFAIFYILKSDSKNNVPVSHISDTLNTLKIETIRKNINGYLASFYGSGSPVTDSVIHLAQTFGIYGAGGKYNPVSADYKSVAEKEKVHFNPISKDELINGTYVCKYTIATDKDSVIAKLTASIDFIQKNITIGEILYEEVFSDSKSDNSLVKKKASDHPDKQGSSENKQESISEKSNVNGNSNLNSNINKDINRKRNTIKKEILSKFRNKTKNNK